MIQDFIRRQNIRLLRERLELATDPRQRDQIEALLAQHEAASPGQEAIVAPDATPSDGHGLRTFTCRSFLESAAQTVAVAILAADEGRARTLARRWLASGGHEGRVEIRAGGRSLAVERRHGEADDAPAPGA